MTIEITEEIVAVTEEFLDKYHTALERDLAMLQEIVDLRNALFLAHEHMQIYLPHYSKNHNVFTAVTKQLGISHEH